MTVWVACAHVRIWIQVSVQSGGDGDETLPYLVPRSGSESDSLEEEDDRRRRPVPARAAVPRRGLAGHSARPRDPAGRERAVPAAGPFRRPVQGLLLADTGRNLDGIAVLGAAFGTSEDDPDNNTGSPRHWERGMVPGDTGIEIEVETMGTVQGVGTDSNTQDAGASGYKESVPCDGRSLSPNSARMRAFARAVTEVPFTIFLHVST